MPITISKAALSKSLREVRDAAREQGRAEGRAEAARMLEFAISLNGHGPATVKALREGINPAVRTSPEADPEDDRQPNTLDAATLAYLDALIDAKTHHADSDGGDVAAVLRGLIEDPAALEAALSGDVLPEAEEDVLLKAFDEEKHPRDDSGRFVGREAIHAAKSDPALAEKLREKTTDPTERKKLDAALAGEVDTGRTKAGLHRERVAASKQQKAERLQKVRTLAEEISMARRGGEDVPPEHFTELAAELPHLTVGQLRSVRESLAASFWGRRRRDEMVTALVRHAKVMAERKRAEQEATDALDFGIDAMTGTTGGTGHADAGRSDLNPWREFDKDKNYGEAQHGGRMFQRQKLMAELPDSDKTSHGTPDTGSILKVPDKVADEQLTQKLNGPDEPPMQPGAAAPVTPDKPEGGATTQSNQEFKKWFSGSKVTGSDGKPLTVYHGATQQFDKFNDGRIFFTDKPDVAMSFAESRAAHAGEDNPAPRLIEANVSIKKPFVIDAKGKPAGEVQFSRGDSSGYRAALENPKYDGVIIRNTSDEGNLFVAKKGDQVRQNRRGDANSSESPNSSLAATPNPAPSGSASAVPKDHAAALSKSRTHHNRRTDTKGTPIGRHVVYRDKAGKVNAVPAASYMGKELLAGRQNQYTVEGQYDFGPDGNPVKVSDSGPTGHQPEKSKGHVAFVNGMEYYKDAAGNLLRADAKLPIDTQGTRFGRFEATPAMADMRIKMLTGSQPEQNRPAVSEPDIKDTHQYTRKEYLGSEYDKEAIRRIGKEHKDAVEAAIATGKPVPPEVLADYPDLAAKYGPIRKSVASGSASDWDSLRAELLQDDAPPG